MGWLNYIKRIARWLLAIIGSAALVLLIRCFAFTSCLIPTEGMEPSLYNGDRIIVNKWSYGLRLPQLSADSYCRWRERTPDYGDVVVFNNPLSKAEPIDRKELFISRCIALPGDTLIVDSIFTPLTPLEAVERTNLHLLVVPAVGLAVDVESWNRTLIMNTIILHEGGDAYISGDTLYVDNRPVWRYRFKKNYYWMASDHLRNAYDSRLFGYLPHDHIVGRACCVWYSKDPEQGILSGYRPGRFFKKVDCTK